MTWRANVAARKHFRAPGMRRRHVDAPAFDCLHREREGQSDRFNGLKEANQMLGQNRTGPINCGALPCRAAAASPSIMTIESGWAVAAINITEGQKDTSGVYAYDLNDFSSVHEGATRDTYPSRIIDRSTTAIELGVENPTALLIDQSGRTVMQCPHLGDGRYQLSASTLAAGVYTIVTQDTLSRTVQRLLVP